MVVSEAGGERVRAVIVETEAYLGWDDPASHAYHGRRYAGNAGIYSPPGHWYVYRAFGIHWCANLVAGPSGLGAAVLLRAVRIIKGEDLVRTRRGGPDHRKLSDGPGKLSQALAINGSLDRQRMRGSPVRIGPGALIGDVRVTPRIGITKAADWPLRFLMA